VSFVFLALETSADLRLVGLYLKVFAVKGYVMKGSLPCWRILLVLSMLAMLACTLLPVALAQALPESVAPQNASSNFLSPRETDTIPVSSGMLAPFLPRIPNLEFGCFIPSARTYERVDSLRITSCPSN
jgi:hypothetical protein